ncbi:MAG: hypothetical protein GC201_08840 [Alphaproteobacteria bacterium]|nr:hypothetical protein [Alphaproteobacteria bacterium]
MRNDFTRPLSIAVVCLAALAMGSALAQDQKDMPAAAGMPSASPMGTQHMKPAMDHEGAGTADAMALKKAEMSAKEAQAKLNAPPPDALVLARAARSKNVDAAKQVLLRNGFTAQQLEGATVVLEDQTGGGVLTPESRISITIEASCCPLKITIIIRL